MIDSDNEQSSEQSGPRTTGTETTDVSKFHYDLTRRITHDLKAPIRQITQLSEMLLEDNREKLDEDSLRTLSMMRERAEKLAELVEAIRSLSNAFCRPVERQLVDLNGILTNAQTESSQPETLLTLAEPISIRTDPILSSLFFNRFFKALFTHNNAEQLTNSRLKLDSDEGENPCLNLLVKNFSIEISQEISLREFSNRIPGPLTQILALAECAQLSDRLGWRVGLYTNKKNDLSVNLYF